LITLTSKVIQAFNTSSGLTWIVKLSLDDATRYWASDNLTISGQEHYGHFILDDGLEDIEQSVDISIGGGLGSIGNTALRLKEIVTQNGLHRDFKPQSSGTELLNRSVDIGCVFKLGTLSTSDIVWLYKGTVDDYNLSIDGIDLDVVGASELDKITLPKELINATDYPQAPKENIGEPLPIVYGTLSGTYSISPYTDSLTGIPAPTICIDKTTMKFAVAGHVVNSFGLAYHRSSGMKGWGLLYTETTIGNVTAPTQDSDDTGIATIVLAAGSITGFLLFHLSTRGIQNTVTNYYNAIDGSDSTTATVSEAGNQYLAMTIDGLPSGNIPEAFGTITIYSGTDGSGENYKIGYVNDNSGVLNNLATYAPAAAGQTTALTGMGGKNSGEIGRIQFVCYCTVVTHTADVKNFGISYYYTISEGTVSAKPTTPIVSRWEGRS